MCEIHDISCIRYLILTRSMNWSLPQMTENAESCCSWERNNQCVGTSTLLHCELLFASSGELSVCPSVLAGSLTVARSAASPDALSGAGSQGVRSALLVW